MRKGEKGMKYLNNYVRRVIESIVWNWLCGGRNPKYENKRTGWSHKVERQKMIYSASTKWQALEHLSTSSHKGLRIQVSSFPFSTRVTEIQRSYMTKRTCNIAGILSQICLIPCCSYLFHYTMLLPNWSPNPFTPLILQKRWDSELGGTSYWMLELQRWITDTSSAGRSHSPVGGTSGNGTPMQCKWSRFWQQKAQGGMGI